MESNKSTHTIRAQILVLTLLALFIISIIAVAIFNIASRDVRQTVQNREYTRLQNISENRVLELAAVYSNGATAISGIASQTAQLTCTQTGTTQYTCIKADGTSVSSIILEDTNTMSNYGLDKDEYFELNLAGYTDSVYFSFTGTTALEFGLITQVTSTQAYKYYGDVFDINSILANSGGDPFTEPSNNHFFSFVNNGTFYSFNLAAALPAGETTQRLRITVRKPQSGGIGLNLSTDVGSPNFARKITASTYDQATATGVVAKVSATVPIAPQALSIFDYALLTDGAVNKVPGG